MAIPPGAELLALFVAVVFLSLLAGIVYRRLFSGLLPDPENRSLQAGEPVGPGELRCPSCGAINEVGFEKCYECASRLPAASGRNERE